MSELTLIPYLFVFSNICANLHASEVSIQNVFVLELSSICAYTLKSESEREQKSIADYKNTFKYFV